VNRRVLASVEFGLLQVRIEPCSYGLAAGKIVLVGFAALA
jgi:hypothetical protein